MFQSLSDSTDESVLPPSRPLPPPRPTAAYPPLPDELDQPDSFHENTRPDSPTLGASELDGSPSEDLLDPPPPPTNSHTNLNAPRRGYLDSEWKPRTIFRYDAETSALVLKNRLRSENSVPTVSTRRTGLFASIPNDCLSVIVSYIPDGRTVISLRLTCRELCRFFDVDCPQFCLNQLHRMYLNLQGFQGPSASFVRPRAPFPSFKCMWVRRLVIERSFGIFFHPFGIRTEEFSSFERESMLCQLRQDRDHEDVFHRNLDWKTQGALRVKRIPRNGELDGGFEKLLRERFPNVEELLVDRCAEFSGMFCLVGEEKSWQLRKFVVYDAAGIRNDVLEGLCCPMKLETLKIENSSPVGENEGKKCAFSGKCLKRFWPELVKLHICLPVRAITDDHLSGFHKLEVLVLHDCQTVTNSAFRPHLGRTLRKIELNRCKSVTSDVFTCFERIEDIIVRRCSRVNRPDVIRALRAARSRSIPSDSLARVTVEVEIIPFRALPGLLVPHRPARKPFAIPWTPLDPGVGSDEDDEDDWDDDPTDWTYS